MACDYQDCTETKAKRPNYAVFLHVFNQTDSFETV